MSEPNDSQARTCIVRHSYYPQELNIKREADALARVGFNVTVICLRGVGQAAREVIDGVSIHRMPVRHRRGHQHRDRDRARGRRPSRPGCASGRHVPVCRTHE